MFLGEYQHTMDAKGRVSLPRKFRDTVGARIVVAKGLEKCVYVYPEQGYKDFLGQLHSGGDFNPTTRAVRRFFTAGAADVEIDSAGRIAIAVPIREHASLGKDVVVAGVGDHIEIWNAASWIAYNEEHALTIEDAAEELSRQGIL